MKKRTVAVLVSLFLGLTCLVLAMIWLLGNTVTGTNRKMNMNRLVVVSPHPVEFMKPLISEFESQTGIKIIVTQCGTTEAIDRITKEDDVDVLWGGSILTVGEYSDCFLDYQTPNKEFFEDKFKNTKSGLTCFTDVPSILMVNTDLLGGSRIQGYEDLLRPELKGKIAFADPSKSSSSFEHIVNMLYAMGKGDPDAGWEYVKSFCGQIDGKLLSKSSLVYEGVANGKYLVGLTFEEAAITMLKLDKHIKIVYMEEGTVTTPDGIYISKKSQNVENAKAFVDFLTSYDTQLFISKKLGRRSVRKDIDDSKLVKPSDELNLLEVDKDLVTDNREKWIERFMESFSEGNDE